MGDADLGGVRQLPQLLRQQRRAQVLADARELALVVAEGGLDDQLRHAQRRQALPQRRVRAGVAGEHPGPLGPMHRVAHGRHGVPGGQHLQPVPAQPQLVAHGQRVEAQHRVGGVGQAAEVGPDHAVEDVRPQGRDRLGQRVHADGRPAGGAAAARHAVGQQADGQHVVEVGVRDDDVVDGDHLVEREVAHAGAGVDEHRAVEQERGRAAAGSDGTRTTENADLHGATAAVPPRTRRAWP